MNESLEPSAACLALIRESEGFRSHAYWDESGWAVGYGSHGPDIGQGTVWTQQQAEAHMQAQVEVNGAWIKRLVTVPLTQGQYDALQDWTYEFGIGHLRNSTMLMKLNSGDYSGAAEELLRWCHEGTEEVPGLLARRQKELAMWLGHQAP